MTLTTNGKNWLAQNAGANNCFAGTGVSYTDADGVPHTGRTGDVVNALATAHTVSKDSSVIIAGTSYAGFKIINDNTDFDSQFIDIGWAYANDGGTGSTGTYCYVSPALDSITISPSTASVQIGYTQQMTKVCYDQHGAIFTCPAVTWLSDHPLIASVDSSSGLVTGISAGSANITCSGGGKTSNLSSITVVTVPPALNSIVVTVVAPGTSSIQVGETTQLMNVCRDQYNSVFPCPTVTWLSDHPLIASVDSSSGLVTGVSAGSANITCSGGGKTSDPLTITVNIVPSTFNSIVISPDTVHILIGATQYLAAVCKDQHDANYPCPTLGWVSTDATIATVDSSSGLVTGVAEGSTSVTARYGDITSNASVIIVTASPPVEAGMGGILVVGLVVGALLIGQGKSPIEKTGKA